MRLVAGRVVGWLSRLTRGPKMTIVSRNVRGDDDRLFKMTGHFSRMALFFLKSISAVASGLPTSLGGSSKGICNS
jgi:hypothetical protein